MPGPVIQATGLVKRFGRGRDAKTALDGLDLGVDEGEVFGFLGPNGAGKTTTIRLMLDFIRPSCRRDPGVRHQPARRRRHPAAHRLPAGDFVRQPPTHRPGAAQLSRRLCAAACPRPASTSWRSDSTWT